MAKDTRKNDAQRPLVWRLVDELIAELRLTPEDARGRVEDMPRLEVLFYAAKVKIDRLRDQGDGEPIEGIAFDDRNGTPVASILLACRGIDERMRMRDLVCQAAAAVLVEKVGFRLRQPHQADQDQRGHGDQRSNIRLVEDRNRRTA